MKAMMPKYNKAETIGHIISRMKSPIFRKSRGGSDLNRLVKPNAVSAAMYAVAKKKIPLAS